MREMSPRVSDGSGSLKGILVISFAPFISHVARISDGITYDGVVEIII